MDERIPEPTSGRIGRNRTASVRARPRALWYGIAAGCGFALLGAAALRWLVRPDLVPTFAWLLGVLVAPVAAAVSTFAMQATWGRVLAAAGLALLAATLSTIVLDYFVTMMVFVPGLGGGPYLGKTEWSSAEVARVAGTWVFGRHMVAYALAIIIGAALGVRLARDQTHRSLRC